MRNTNKTFSNLGMLLARVIKKNKTFMLLFLQKPFILRNKKELKGGSLSSS